jgi:N4-gp56 family major capsid protein
MAFSPNPATGTTNTTNLDLAKAAYDRLARFALRPELYFDNVADVKPTNQSMPGSSVIFPIISDLAVASSPINESTDVTPQSISQSTVTVSLAEYGNSVLTTAALRGEAYVEIDPVVANVIGYNAGVSIDEVARDVLKAGSNVSYSGLATSRATVAKTDVLKAADIRAVKAKLRSQNVPNFNGFYTAYIHPNVAYDFTSETGSAAWRDPHTYSQPGEIWAGELGAFEGFRFIETPRSPVFANDGSGSNSTVIALSVTSGSTTATYTNTTGVAQIGVNDPIVSGSTSVPSGTTVVGVSGPVLVSTTYTWTLTLSAAATATTTSSAGAAVNVGAANVFGTLCVGRQSLAKAYSMIDGNTESPHVVPGPITDYLRRFVPWGWYWLGGYSIYRQASVQRIESGSSLTYADPGIDQ